MRAACTGLKRDKYEYRTYLKQLCECLGKGLEIVHVIESWPYLDILEEGHAEDREDEHDEEEQESNVDQCREGHNQREEERPNAFGPLDQTKNAANFHYTDLQEPKRADVALSQFSPDHHPWCPHYVQFTMSLW